VEGGYVKIYRKLRERGHLKLMPDPALRLFVIFLLAAEWRRGQHLPRGCLEMSYTDMRDETGYGRSKISAALCWLERPPPPIDGPYIHRQGEKGQKLRIQVVNYHAYQSQEGTTTSPRTGLPAESSPTMGLPPVPEWNSLKSDKTQGVPESRDPSPRIARPQSQNGTTQDPQTRSGTALEGSLRREEDQESGSRDPLARKDPDPTPPMVPPTAPAAEAVNEELAAGWERVLPHLRGVVTPGRLLEGLRPVELRGQTLVLGAQDADQADRLTRRWAAVIGATLARVSNGKVRRCEVKVREQPP